MLACEVARLYPEEQMQARRLIRKGPPTNADGPLIRYTGASGALRRAGCLGGRRTPSFTISDSLFPIHAAALKIGIGTKLLVHAI